jgi:hypothetical protein
LGEVVLDVEHPKPRGVKTIKKITAKPDNFILPSFVAFGSLSAICPDCVVYFTVPVKEAMQSGQIALQPLTLLLQFN